MKKEIMGEVCQLSDFNESLYKIEAYGSEPSISDMSKQDTTM